MKLSLLALYENIKGIEVECHIKNSPGPFLKGIRIFSDTQSLEKDYLYMDVENRLKENFKDFAFISLEPVENGFQVKNKEDLFHVFNAVMEIFNRFQQWSEITKEKLIQGEDLQSIFNLCEMVTRETVYLTDISMKMYVHTTPTLMDEVSAIWRYQVHYGYMPIHIMNQLITSGELEQMNQFRKAFTFDTKTFNLPYTCRNIYHGNILKAHLFIVSIHSNPKQTHKEIADELGRLLSPFVCTSKDFNSRAGQLYENFFLDVMNHGVTNETLIQQQINIFGWKIKDNYCVVIIDIENGRDEQIQFMINYLCDSKFDCKAFEKEKYIVGIFHVRDKKSKSEFTDTIQNMLTKMNAKGAISKNFEGLKNINTYYKQLVTILKYCKKNDSGRNLFLQENFGLYSILNTCLEKHDAYELCHPDVVSLYNYDKKYKTDYLETLYQYLLNERNAVKAAQVLFIHRNTMNYRLEKLNKLLTFDFENSTSRYYILFSIFLLRYQLKRSLDEKNDGDKE